MNAVSLIRSCPIAFDKFMDFIMANNKAQFCRCDLFSFFDLEEIFISTRVDSFGVVSKIKVNDFVVGSYYSQSRDDSELQVFTKAFELLEERLALKSQEIKALTKN